MLSRRLLWIIGLFAGSEAATFWVTADPANTAAQFQAMQRAPQRGQLDLPDTDRMLLMLGFGGSAFKKVYFCPLRGRPVSESVDADDLIVNNAATDLKNAKRVTHRIYMRSSTVRRMQILGVYKDMDLPVPKDPTLDAAQREERAQRSSATCQNRARNAFRSAVNCLANGRLIPCPAPGKWVAVRWISSR